MSRHYFPFNGKELWIDDLLRRSLDTIVYNMKHNKQGNWDAMIVVSGDREVGTGKSTFAQLLGAYLAHRFGTTYTLEDVYFEAEDMVKHALKKGKFRINHYDEARRGFASTKRLQKLQEDLIDFFTESRQLNQVTLLCLPDFFSLSEEVAVARSTLLLNCIRMEVPKSVKMYANEAPVDIVEWKRGRVIFYNRPQKARIHDRFRNTKKKWYYTKDFKSYSFAIDFNDFNILNKDEYEAKKAESIAKYKKKTEFSLRELKYKKENALLLQLMKKEGINDRKIAHVLGTEPESVQKRRKREINRGISLEKPVLDTLEDNYLITTSPGEGGEGVTA